MKQFFNVILAAGLLLGLYACTDETIGVSITDGVSSIIEDSSFVITGHSVRNDRVQMRTSTKMLGVLQRHGCLPCRLIPLAPVLSGSTLAD